MCFPQPRGLERGPEGELTDPGARAPRGPRSVAAPGLFWPRGEPGGAPLALSRVELCWVPQGQDRVRGPHKARPHAGAPVHTGAPTFLREGWT